MLGMKSAVLSSWQACHVTARYLLALHNASLNALESVECVRSIRVFFHVEMSTAQTLCKHLNRITSEPWSRVRSGFRVLS
jgi:hypothetical protein